MVSMATQDNNQEESFAALFEESLKHEDVKEGDIVKGRVIHVGKDHVVVDIGYKSEGTIPLYEFTQADGSVGVKEGDEIDVFLESRENEDGLCVLSKEKADRLKVWDEISGACERDELIEGHHQRAREGRPLGHHPRRREGVPPRLAGGPAPGAQPGRVHRQAAPLQGHQVQQEARQHRAVAPRAPREGARRAEGDDAREVEGRPDRRGYRQEPHRVRRLHRPRRHRRPAPHHGHVAGAASRTRPSCSRSATTCA